MTSKPPEVKDTVDGNKTILPEGFDCFSFTLGILDISLLFIYTLFDEEPDLQDKNKEIQRPDGKT